MSTPQPSHIQFNDCKSCAAAAKEEAEEADKQRREAAEALKKEEDAKMGTLGDAEAVTQEDTVNTGSQSVLQVTSSRVSGSAEALNKELDAVA